MIIYSIKNLINNKEYIGLTKRTLEQRWKQHIRESSKETYWEWNTPLGNAIKKYGKESFKIFCIKECNSIEELKSEEIRIIQERKSHVSQNGYNVSLGGDGRLGVKLSQETKDKIGAGNKGKVYTQEVKNKISEIKKKQFAERKHSMTQASKILVNGKERFDCIKDFTIKYNLKYSSVSSSLLRNNGKTTFKNYLIERL
jgi:group I intron endonuclease